MMDSLAYLELTAVRGKREKLVSLEYPAVRASKVTEAFQACRVLMGCQARQE
jgi:hypothetical protein